MIETVYLGKNFGAVRAVVDLNLKTNPGEIFGFLGPNGAGKTTTIDPIVGLWRRSFLPFSVFIILASITYGAVSFFLVWLFGVLTVKRLENLEWKFG